MSKYHVLLVDDEPQILKSLRRTLRREGYELHVADCVESAINVLKQEPINLLVTDYRMPGLTGDHLLRFAREHCPQIPRVLLTGYSSLDNAAVFTDSGLAQYLIRKPWNNDELCKVIALSLQCAQEL